MGRQRYLGLGSRVHTSHSTARDLGMRFFEVQNKQ
ncbi:uncharacterized protein G2W53_013123 [Senna tora]|uniref:Uncharacterized protein n=1 Tax=Senna tora TaxID=362788 RepID=A0A834TYC4_9FABA|nr:uncharacterized protein G2W53_013123 [Senna tora]